MKVPPEWVKSPARVKFPEVEVKVPPDIVKVLLESIVPVPPLKVDDATVRPRVKVWVPEPPVYDPLPPDRVTNLAKSAVYDEVSMFPLYRLKFPSMSMFAPNVYVAVLVSPSAYLPLAKFETSAAVKARLYMRRSSIWPSNGTTSLPFLSRTPIFAVSASDDASVRISLSHCVLSMSSVNVNV